MEQLILGVSKWMTSKSTASKKYLAWLLLVSQSDASTHVQRLEEVKFKGNIKGL